MEHDSERICICRLTELEDSLLETQSYGILLLTIWDRLSGPVGAFEGVCETTPKSA